MALWARYRWLGEIRASIYLPAATILTLLKGFRCYKKEGGRYSHLLDLSVIFWFIYRQRCVRMMGRREDLSSQSADDYRKRQMFEGELIDKSTA